jgi:LacI family purine nucleotide synthesis repressor
MSVTIKDIAKIAGVSHTTVARALNDSELVHTETREKIKKIALELNYAPNYNAKSLVLDKSYIIGLFFSTLRKGTSSDFFHQAIIGVNDIIKEKYNVVVKGIDDYQNYAGINKRNFDGILVMSQREEDNPFILHVVSKNIPLVVMNRDIKDERIATILADDRKGAYEAAKNLIENGHKKIAVIEGREGFKSSVERKEGYLQAMMESGLSIIDDYIVSGDYDLESGYSGMNRLLHLVEVPTAVFCFNDTMAIGAIKAVYEQGLSVPDDISVIGFDDSIFSPYITPSLTTVKRSIEKMSMEGAKHLIDYIENQNRLPEKVYIETQLVVRNSVKRKL